MDITITTNVIADLQAAAFRHANDLETAAMNGGIDSYFGKADWQKMFDAHDALRLTIIALADEAQRLIIERQARA